MLPIHQPTTEDLTRGTDGALIAAGKVNGTAVYGADDARIGEIEDLMLEKRSGTVQYAVLSFGGVLLVGAKQYALPWRMLRYEPRLEGFVVDELTREKLDAAPVHSADARADWARIDSYWAM